MTAIADRGAVRRTVVPALIACFAASVVAGPRFVPAAGHARPEWLLGPYGDGVGLEGPWFFVCLLLAFVAYLGLVAVADRMPARVLWAVVAGAVALFLLAPPLLSQDVFSYIAYPRLGARHGLDPYVAVPAAIPHDAVPTRCGPLDTLGVVGFDQSLASRHSVPSTLARLVDLGVAPVRGALELAYVVLLVVLVVRTARGGDWVRAAGWAALGLLLATSWLMPWYVLWALSFAAVAGDGRLSVAVLALCAFQLASRVPL